MERPSADSDPDRDDAGSGGGFSDGATAETADGAAGDDGGRDGDGDERGSAGDREDESAEEEWQFGLDEVGPDGVVEPEPEPLEPGQPTLENVFFVLLGVVGTLLLLSTVV
jgi:hypothetical protein